MSAALPHAVERDARANADARIAHLEQVISSLVGRVEALERSAQPKPLAEHNSDERARAGRLRELIGRLLEDHPGAPRGAAKRIYAHLLETDVGRAESPSIRTVQHHIAQIRKAAVLRL